VKLLFDENLPARLIRSVSDSFPGSSHVSTVGLSSSPDEEVWEFARDNGFTLVSKDSDFHQMSFVRGYPPKVVWMRLGNCSVAELEAVLTASIALIREFVESKQESVLLIGPSSPDR